MGCFYVLKETPKTRIYLDSVMGQMTRMNHLNAAYPARVVRQSMRQFQEERIESPCWVQREFESQPPSGTQVGQANAEVEYLSSRSRYNAKINPLPHTRQVKVVSRDTRSRLRRHTPRRVPHKLTPL